MTDAPDSGRVDPETRLKDHKGVRNETWKQTNEEMQLLAEERRDEGWDVVTFPAVHTSVFSKEVGDDDEFGIEYVVADNHAEEFSAAFEPGTFTQYQVYRTIVSQNAFQVLELLAPDSGEAILVAGMYKLQDAQGLEASARDEEALYSFFKRIDGTRLGTIRHEEFEAMLPRPGQ
jgi:hypothetical protein